MKILFITPEGFDTPGPNNQMAMVMISDFLNAGINVHLVQSRRKKINPEIPPSLDGRDGFVCDVIDRKVIDKSRFINRYIDEVAYAVRSYICWKKVKDADVVFLQSCPTVIYQLILLRIFNRKPIVYNIYDVFPGHAYDIGVIKSKFIYKSLRFIQKFAYKLSTIITVLSEDMKNKVIEQGALRGKVRIVPAWYDISSTSEVDKKDNRFIEKYQIDKSKFYVQYAGTIGYVFRYETVIELAQRIKDYTGIVIQIVGDGNLKAEFVQHVKELCLENIIFYPLQPVEIVPDVYSACDVCLIPLRKGVIGNGIPSKAPILMACHKVIVNSVEIESEYAKMFINNKMGISIDISNPDALAEAVIDLYNNPQKVAAMADNAQHFGRENYSSTMSIRKYCDIFNELLR